MKTINSADVKNIVLSMLEGKTQRELACDFGMSPGKLNDYLRTGIEPSPSLLKALRLKKIVMYVKDDAPEKP